MERISNFKEIISENNFLENKSETKTEKLLLEEKISNSDLGMNRTIDNVGEKTYNIGEKNLDEILSHFDKKIRNEIEEKP